MKFRSLSLLAIGVILLAFAGALVWNEVFGWHRPYVDWDPDKLAAYLVEHRRSSEECWDLVVLDPFGPQAATLRAGCVYRIATLLSDPSVCGLLLPNEYGMYCIGDIWGPLTDKSNCHWYKDNAVRCFEGEALTPHIFDCSDPSQRAVSDECKHRFAFKQKDSTLCDGIINATLQSVCKVRIDAWERYPQLRSTIYFNDNIQ